MNYQVTGFILKKKALGEHDLLLTIYTCEQGKLTLAVPNAKKKAELLAKLDYFYINKYFVAARKTLDVVHDIERVEVFQEISSDYNIAQALAFLLKLFDRLTVPEEANRELYQLMVKIMELANNRQNLENIREYFAFNFLKIEGLLPEHQKSITELEFNKIVSEYLGEKIDIRAS